MNKIKKCITAACGVAPRGTIPQRFGNAGLAEYLADNGDADGIELPPERGDAFRVVLFPTLAAERQLGLYAKIITGSVPWPYRQNGASRAN